MLTPALTAVLTYAVQISDQLKSLQKPINPLLPFAYSPSPSRKFSRLLRKGDGNEIVGKFIIQENKSQCTVNSLPVQMKTLSIEERADWTRAKTVFFLNLNLFQDCAIFSLSRLANHNQDRSPSVGIPT